MVNLCGIDEAGRGPLAGPLCVAGVVLTSQIDGLNDSKKISHNKRVQLFQTITNHSHYHIVMVDAMTIDQNGLTLCIHNAIQEIIQVIQAPQYLIDGNFSFGLDNVQHKIKADQSVPEVSAASILAKVTRDHYMMDIAHTYPQYGFDQHKGYGTQQHREAIQTYGLTPLHRKSFKLKNKS